MTGGGRIASGLALVVGVTAWLATTVGCTAAGSKSTSLMGAVLENSSDPRRQRPMANAEVTLTSTAGTLKTKSDASGLFRFTVTPAMKREESITLRVQHAGYGQFEMTGPVKNEVYVVRLKPLHEEQTETTGPVVALRDLRVRYSVKVSATVDVGSFVKTFEIAGSGGTPCKANSRCSPDGKWQAVAGSFNYDAGNGNQFHEVRISCIAGPCPFTSIDKPDLSDSNQRLKVSALNWSDTATFLVEAQVTRAQIDDVVRYSIPVVFGSGMNFALPGTAEGPSIEADVNGTEIVYPLGPNLFLSWATCTLKTDANGAKLYRCELKPGYRFE